MKKLIYLFLAGILLAGCSMQENPVAQGYDSDTPQNWLKFNSGMQVEEQITACKVMNGDLGGVFAFTDKPDNVKIQGRLTVPSGAFNGSLEICVVMDGQTTFVNFLPSHDFATPLILDLTYRDVNLNGINPDSIDFYYIGENGQLVPAQYDSKEIDIEKGVLKVTNVRIFHFSRYGWAK